MVKGTNIIFKKLQIGMKKLLAMAGHTTAKRNIHWDYFSLPNNFLFARLVF